MSIVGFSGMSNSMMLFKILWLHPIWQKSKFAKILFKYHVTILKICQLWGFSVMGNTMAILYTSRVASNMSEIEDGNHYGVKNPRISVAILHFCHINAAREFHIASLNCPYPKTL